MKKKILAVLVLCALLCAGCADRGDNIAQPSAVSESSIRTEGFSPAERVTANVTEPAETTVTTEEQVTETVPPTEIITTTIATTAETTPYVETTTEAVTTTTAETTVITTTTAAPVPPPADGVTANGYSITTVDGITYVNGTLIANKTYALPESYNPGGLTGETLDAFWQMQSAAAAEGLSIFVKSGFRSYYDQRYIYNGYAASDGVANADRYSARAGHSEHQSGMAIDVNCTYTSFANEPEGIWLKNNCYKYGFIIRYPEGKEHITGYMYEPWHIRYVGVDLATAVTESGLCLEEYFGITSSYS